MTEEIRSKAQKLAEHLQESGHPQHATALSKLLSSHLAGNALLLALKTVCDTLLTAVEAFDPVSEMELERFRRNVDDLLTPEKPEEG
jgi:hypothetical protein